MPAETGGRAAKEYDGPQLVPHHTAPDKGVPYGFSRIGVHDLVPVLGYREYWYPGIMAKDVGKRSWWLFGRRKPVSVKLLGEDVLFFPGKDGKVAAIWNRCPHRGAIFTPKGRCEFDGTISCPYHGYTFDETGTCVAALTEGPNSGQVGKMKVKSYPTATVRGIVFIWMGQTEPVPLEDDLPEELFDDRYVIVPHRRLWIMNWTLTMENSGDNHASYLHRFRLLRLLNLEAFQKVMCYWPGVKIMDQTDKSFAFRPAGPAPMQAYYPGLGKKWPQHVWFRFMPQRKPGQKTLVNKPYSHEYRLPCIARVHVSGPGYLHERYVTPRDENTCWQFFLGTALGTSRFKRIYWTLYLKFWYRLMTVTLANGYEDVSCQRYDRLDVTAPQKLGANDATVILWRRRLPLTSRDNIRVWKKGIDVSQDQESEAKSYEVQEDPVHTADD
jgi:phenylpropionate dioxygenase-like ring-hydroxylating dioxygenase large terminal subunit